MPSARSHRLRCRYQDERAVLALLLLHAHEVVSSDRLIEELWAGEPPGTAQTALQGYVSQLRKTLGRDAVVTRAPGYVLAIAPEQLDLNRFQALRERARAALAGGGAPPASTPLPEGPSLL